MVASIFGGEAAGRITVMLMSARNIIVMTFVKADWRDTFWNKKI